MNSLRTAILQQALSNGETIDLNSILKQLQGMAIGVWRRQQDSLVLLQFTHDGTLTQEVATGFQQATAQVSLSQADLGIVAAVLRGEPAPALVVPNPDLPGSASWLERFGSRMSLSWPVFQSEEQTGQAAIVGVLAIAYAEPLSENDQPWQLLNAALPVM